MRSAKEDAVSSSGVDRMAITHLYDSKNKRMVSMLRGYVCEIRLDILRKKGNVLVILTPAEETSPKIIRRGWHEDDEELHVV